MRSVKNWKNLSFDFVEEDIKPLSQIQILAGKNTDITDADISCTCCWYLV